jgi:hypothetical protein
VGVLPRPFQFRAVPTSKSSAIVSLRGARHVDDDLMAPPKSAERRAYPFALASKSSGTIAAHNAAAGSDDPGSNAMNRGQSSGILN